MIESIEKYVLDNYTSLDFPQSYETFIKDNYKDIVPDLILGDERLTDITNEIIKGEEVDDSYLGTFKDYYGESVYEPENDFTKSLALQARYIDDAEYLEWLNDDKMAKILAEFPTRGDLIDHLGPTIEDISEKYGDDPNLDLLIDNMTYKSHPLAFYEFSQSDDFSEQDSDFGFREWVRKGINSIKKITTRSKRENDIITKESDNSEQDDKVINNIKSKSLELVEPPKKSGRNYGEIPMGQRQDRNPNHKGDLSSKDMALSDYIKLRYPKARRITKGMQDTLTYNQMKRSNKWMIKNSQHATLQEAKKSFKGASKGGGAGIGSAIGLVGLGAIGAVAAPKVIKYISDKKQKQAQENQESNKKYLAYAPDYSCKNFSLEEDMYADILASNFIRPLRLTLRESRLIKYTIKCLTEAYFRNKYVPRNMSEEESVDFSPPGRRGNKQIKAQKRKDSKIPKVESSKDNTIPNSYNSEESTAVARNLLGTDKDKSKEPSKESLPVPSKNESKALPEPEKKPEPAVNNLPAPVENPKVPAVNSKVEPSAEEHKNLPEPAERPQLPASRPEQQSDQGSNPDSKPQPDSQPTESNQESQPENPKIYDTEYEVVDKDSKGKKGDNPRRVKISSKKKSKEDEIKPRVSAEQKSHDSLIKQGWSEEEISNLKNSKYSQSKLGQSKVGKFVGDKLGLNESKYSKELKSIDKQNRKNEINESLKTAAGFKDLPAVEKGGKSKGTDWGKIVTKGIKSYGRAQAASKIAGGVKDVALAMMAPQYYGNRPSVN